MAAADVHPPLRQEFIAAGPDKTTRADSAHDVKGLPMTTTTTTTTTPLPSKWPITHDLAGGDEPCRLEGEVADLVVQGTIPPELNGTFYRVMTDPFVPPHPHNIPLDGDGNISAFHFHSGRVDLKIKYIETERYLLERAAGKALFGLYRNPFTHHPCVRAAVDSTANTNLVYWAGHLLALKEGGLPYAVDPRTLETKCYDPFDLERKLGTKTFTAHPKYDPFQDELVCYGYEARGLASRDTVVFALDHQGAVKWHAWLQLPWCAPVHDCAITENFVVLVLWPFEGDVERMKAGGHHWAWSYARSATFVVVPRGDGQVARERFGWGEGECRVYEWQNAMLIHAGGAWEDPSTGHIHVSTSRVLDNAFPFFPPTDNRMPAADAQADFVEWTLNPDQATGTKVQDPRVLLPTPAEFPRTDERFTTHPSKTLFLNVWVPDPAHPATNIFHSLNGLALLTPSSPHPIYFDAGADTSCQEPVFVPRSADAEEGDGWVLAMVERRREGRCEVVVLDSRTFGEGPVARVRLPLRVRAQVHGNWVGGDVLGWKEEEGEGVVRKVREGGSSGRGALEGVKQ
ncbi:lignostilbene alpha,beta-dioxygenase I [Teratosphaeria destructans]|uniref:Lignostilbene alpha,beta-dioxygenase I n=1 Tax=Teratosphaeria destructans TaxID=418781 RepID=A0A9W7W1H4_9PEZI|nr:lignostilbene alpha,beta-dioxygenase I [Teratosphaeria destructans]